MVILPGCLPGTALKEYGSCGPVTARAFIDKKLEHTMTTKQKQRIFRKYFID
jgi:hypothetical protein